MTLKLAKGLELPADAVAETFAFLAKRGAGKTYAAGVLAEELLDAGAQVVVLDPVGKWWGLRLASDGKSNAFEVPVFGGQHGDLPLSGKSGKAAARAVVEHRLSAVFDLLLFDTENEKRSFVADFCRELYRLKSQQDSPAPIHVFLEEAEEFIPQQFDSADTKMIGAVKKLIKLGRNFGVGVSLISQRSAGLNKQALSQTEYLVVLRTRSPHDLKAIRGWIEHAGAESARETVKELSTLPIGTAYVYGGEQLAARVQIRKKRTLDTSATPKAAKRGRGKARIETPKLSDAELSHLREALEEGVREAEANDPRALRGRIAQLEKELRAARSAAPAKVTEVEVQVPCSVVTPQEVEELQRATAALDDALSNAIAATDAVERVSKSAGEALARVSAGEMPFGPRRKLSTGNGQSGRAAPAPRPRQAKAPTSKPAGDLGTGPAAVLAAIASLHPRPVSKGQAATLAGYSSRSSTIRNYLSILRSAGLVDGGGDALRLTGAGELAAGDTDPVRTTEELLELWCPRLGAGPAAIIDLLVEAYPSGLDRQAIADATGYSAASSTIRNYLSKLASNGLMERRGGECFASDSLFPGGAQ